MFYEQNYKNILTKGRERQANDELSLTHFNTINIRYYYTSTSLRSIYSKSNWQSYISKRINNSTFLTIILLNVVPVQGSVSSIIRNLGAVASPYNFSQYLDVPLLSHPSQSSSSRLPPVPPAHTLQ